MISNKQKVIVVIISLLTVGALSLGQSRKTQISLSTSEAATSAEAAKTLVVYNTSYPESLEVADYYMQKRGIPAANKCAITDGGGNNGYMGDHVAYNTIVKTPIQNCLTALGPDNILYIVFSYMTPFKIWDPTYYQIDAARAVDSLVANIWSTSDQYYTYNYYSAMPQSGQNIYIPFQSLASYRAQNQFNKIYSVWRLDAGSADIAKGLVDKAMSAEANGLSGQGCFDLRYGPAGGADTGYESGDWDIERSAQTIEAAGFPVTRDTNAEEFGAAPAPLRCDNAAFYAGWYSYGQYHDVFSWATGAMGWHLDSLGLENPRNSTTSWGAGAIARGITMTTGSVQEPYLELIPHPDSFFKNLTEGANVGDAMLRNTTYLNWVILNVGDPLYRPFLSNNSGDTTPPTISLSSPKSGENVSGTISVSATASDNTGVVGVQFQVDQGNLSSEDTTAPYSVSWNTIQANNSAHILTAIARDAAGNITTSSPVSVTVNNAGGITTPTVSLTAPVSGATVSGTTSISAIASDNTGVSKVEFYVDQILKGTATQPLQSLQNNQFLFGFSWDTTNNGTHACSGAHTHILQAKAYDAAGNIGTSATLTVNMNNPSYCTGTTPTLIGDLNGDKIVNSLDWSIMNNKWFTSDSTADINHDGIVNTIDFSLLNANWFKTIP